MIADVPSVREILQPGGALFGNYELRSELQPDHLGERAVARSVPAQREVTVRLLSARLSASGHAHIAALRSLEHPKLISRIEWGEHRGYPWVVSDRHRSARLSDALLGDGASLPLEEFVPLIAQVLMAVGHAHEREIVVGPILARDVMLGERGGKALTIKLADFGLARLLVERPFDLPSPPELRGRWGGSASSDVFEIGLLMHHMLSGAHAIGPDAPRLRLGAVRPDLPATLLALIDDTMDPTPTGRPRDANEVVERLIDAVPKSMFKLPSSRPAARADESAGFSHVTPIPQPLPRPPDASAAASGAPGSTSQLEISTSGFDAGPTRWWVYAAAAAALLGIGVTVAATRGEPEDEVTAAVDTSAIPPTPEPIPPTPTTVVVAAPAPAPSIEPPRPVVDAAPAVVETPAAVVAAEPAPRAGPKRSTRRSESSSPTAPTSIAPPPATQEPASKPSSKALLVGDDRAKPRSSELLLGGDAP